MTTFLVAYSAVVTILLILAIAAVVTLFSEQKEIVRRSVARALERDQ